MKIEKYKKDIGDLCSNGELLYYKMVFENHPEEEKETKKNYPELHKKVIEKISSFSEKYQEWYSESLEVIRQILPSRMDDFIGYYKPSKTRKEINYENYTIVDALQGLRTTWLGETKVDAKAAITKFRQQLKILESLKKKFESSLFDIRQLVQADIFDNELDVAEELVKKGFTRAAGAVAGVVLEGHLETVCGNHGVKISKKKPTIADFNDVLKKEDVIDTPDWRKIQHLGDLRNLCDHKKKIEPKKEEIEELIEGVKRIMKNIF